MNIDLMGATDPALASLAGARVFAWIQVLGSLTYQKWRGLHFLIATFWLIIVRPSIINDINNNEVINNHLVELVFRFDTSSFAWKMNVV